MPTSALSDDGFLDDVDPIGAGQISPGHCIRAASPCPPRSPESSVSHGTIRHAEPRSDSLNDTATAAPSVSRRTGAVRAGRTARAITEFAEKRFVGNGGDRSHSDGKGRPRRRAGNDPGTIERSARLAPTRRRRRSNEEAGAADSMTRPAGDTGTSSVRHGGYEQARSASDGDRRPRETPTRRPARCCPPT